MQYCRFEERISFSETGEIAFYPNPFVITHDSFRLGKVEVAKTHFKHSNELNEVRSLSRDMDGLSNPLGQTYTFESSTGTRNHPCALI